MPAVLTITAADDEDGGETGEAQPRSAGFEVERVECENLGLESRGPEQDSDPEFELVFEFGSDFEAEDFLLALRPRQTQQ